MRWRRKQEEDAVHIIYVEQLLTLGSMPDPIASELGLQVRTENEDDLRHVIRKLITPYFERWDDDK